MCLIGMFVNITMVLFILQFPLCDGTHNKHNTETGDNVGPVVLKRRGK